MAEDVRDDEKDEDEGKATGAVDWRKFGIGEDDEEYGGVGEEAGDGEEDANKDAAVGVNLAATDPNRGLLLSDGDMGLFGYDRDAPIVDARVTWGTA